MYSVLLTNVNYWPSASCSSSQFSLEFLILFLLLTCSAINCSPLKKLIYFNLPHTTFMQFPLKCVECIHLNVTIVKFSLNPHKTHQWREKKHRVFLTKLDADILICMPDYFGSIKTEINTLWSATNTRKMSHMKYIYRHSHSEFASKRLE